MAVLQQANPEVFSGFAAQLSAPADGTTRRKRARCDGSAE
jgi:hypothetical protein